MKRGEKMHGGKTPFTAIAVLLRFFQLFILTLALQSIAWASSNKCVDKPFPCEWTGCMESSDIPPDYVRASSEEVPKNIKFRQFLSYPMGAVILFSSCDKEYAAVLEEHYHPPGGPEKPWGIHKGVSLFIRRDRVQSLLPNWNVKSD